MATGLMQGCILPRAQHYWSSVGSSWQRTEQKAANIKKWEMAQDFCTVLYLDKKASWHLIVFVLMNVKDAEWKDFTVSLISPFIKSLFLLFILRFNLLCSQRVICQEPFYTFWKLYVYIFILSNYFSVIFLLQHQTETSKMSERERYPRSLLPAAVRLYNQHCSQ